MTLNPNQFGDFGYMAMNKHRAIGPMGELLHPLVPKKYYRGARRFEKDIRAGHNKPPDATLRKLLKNEPPGEVMLGIADGEDEPDLYRVTPKLRKPPV